MVSKKQRFLTGLNRLDRFTVRLGRLEYRGHSDDGRPIFHQKRIDLQIGLDVASLVFNRRVDIIAVVSGDSDLIPAIELAKNSGIIIRLVHGPQSSYHQDLWDIADDVFIGDSTLFVRTAPELTSASDPPLPGKHSNLRAANVSDARPSIESLSDPGLPAGAWSRNRSGYTSDFTQYCAIIENSDAVGLIKELVTQNKAPRTGGLEEFFSTTKCPSCGAALRIRKGRTYFLACSKYPACKNTLHLEAEWIQAYLYQYAEQGSPVVCDNCGPQLVARKGPYGIFLACPKCRAKKDLGEII